MKIKPSPKAGRVVLEVDRRDEPLLEGGARQVRPSLFRLKKILVPTDFSECSKKALQYALPFAQQFGASITLMHVVQINYAGGEFGPIDYPLLERELREGGQKQLEDLVRSETLEELEVHSQIRAGRPVTEIVEFAKKEEVDLIILATHGYTGIKHVIMGSTAENVVRYAPCPVLIVREHEHEFVGELESGGE